MDESKRFVKLLTGEANTPVNFRLIHDGDRNTPVINLYGTYDHHKHTLKKYNNSGYGVFITVNETDGKGSDESHITKLRACYLDVDGTSINNWGTYPSFITARSDSNYHCYWLINDSDFEEYKIIQQKLAAFYKVKDVLFDVPRVLRLPGYNHLKNPESPLPYIISWTNPNLKKYNLNELSLAHPVLNFTPIINTVIKGDEITDDNETAINIFLNRLNSLSLEKGALNNTIYIAANFAKDQGLTQETAIKHIIKWYSQTEFYNKKSDIEIKIIVKNAYKYGQNSTGAKTSSNLFKENPITKQIGSVDDLRIIVDGVAISGAKYGKNHSVNAKLFLNESDYKFITVAQETYKYTGTHWQLLEAKELDAMVARAMASARPIIGQINGTVEVLKLVTQYKLPSAPCWINGGDDMPNPKNFIIFKNGILNIDENSWLDHTPDLFYKHCLDYDYEPSATCNNFINYLKSDVFDTDQELITTLQEWIGYLLINNYDFQKFALFLGASRAGKGTISGIIQHIVGEHNVSAPTLTKLAKDVILQDLANKPVAIIGDAQKVSQMYRDVVYENFKMITGGDPITFDRKHISASKAIIPSRFTLLANQMPEFIDPSGALSKRMLIFTFRNSYYDKEDPKLLQRLLEESPGILNWALDGLRRLRINGRFTVSKDSEEMLSSLAEDLSPITEFIKDCITVTGIESNTYVKSDLYRVYKRWCAANDNTPLGQRNFKSQLMASNYKIKHRRIQTNSKREWHYIGLKVIDAMETNNLVEFPKIKQG